MTDRRPSLFRPVLAIACALLCLAATSRATARGKTLRLFNGRNLQGFYGWLVNHHYDDPNLVFSVVEIDGGPAIRVSGEDWGGFATRERHADYHLTFEYRWGAKTWGARADRTKDSGVLLHCQGRDGNTARDFNGPWMQSQECQIIQGGTGDFIMVGGFDESGNRVVPRLTATVSKDRDNETVYDPKGTLTELQGGRINWFGRDPDWVDRLNFRGKNDVESPDDQWTKVECICDRDSITNIVNGTVVNTATKSSLTSGKIQFQSEGAEIYFRNITLRPVR